MRNQVLGIFLSFVVVGLFFFNLGGDVYWPPWAFLMTGLVTYFAFKTKEKLPLVLALTFWYVAINAINIVEFRASTAAMKPIEIMVLKHLAGTTCLEFMLLSAFFFGFWKHIRRPLAWGLYFGGLLHVCSLLFDQLVLQRASGAGTLGLLGNRSIGASFVAVWFFFTLHCAGEVREHEHWGKSWIRKSAFLAIPALMVSQSGISYLAFVLGFCSLLFSFMPQLWPGIGVVLVAAVGMGSYIKPQFFTRINRYPAWALFAVFWRENFSPWIGSGLGTFKLWGSTVQQLAHFMEGRWFLWAHNDWLQIFFELGIIGGVLAISVFVYILKKAWGQPALFGAIVSFGVIMLGNYPMHIAATGLLGWWLLFEAVWGDQWKKDFVLGSVLGRS